MVPAFQLPQTIFHLKEQLHKRKSSPTNFIKMLHYLLLKVSYYQNMNIGLHYMGPKEGILHKTSYYPIIFNTMASK